MPASRPIEQRLWEKVAIGDADECWPWTGGTVKDSRGMEYGSIKYEGKARRAHVVAFIVVYGFDPAPDCVCHSCDVPLCCNGGHLWAGTRADNNADMVAKGRNALNPFATGDGNPSFRVTDDMVCEIVRLHNDGAAYSEIALSLNISAATACRTFNKAKELLK